MNRCVLSPRTNLIKSVRLIDSEITQLFVTMAASLIFLVAALASPALAAYFDLSRDDAGLLYPCPPGDNFSSTFCNDKNNCPKYLNEFLSV